MSLPSWLVTGRTPVRVLSFMLIVIVVVAPLPFIISSVYAASFTVTKTADTNDGTCDSDCSLREAIIAANANPGADTITLPAGTYTLSIAGAGEDASATGDLDINGEVTITGAGAGSTIIDGNDTDRVFEIQNATARFASLTIRNGQAVSGAGIAVDNATLFLTDVIVDSNTATNYAGGIGLFASTATLDRTTVQNNTAVTTSGGIDLEQSRLVTTNSTISGNRSDGEAGGIGLYDAPSSIDLLNTTITQNHADDDNNSNTQQYGGILIPTGALATIRNTIIAQNYRGSGTTTEDNFFGTFGGDLTTSPAAMPNLDRLPTTVGRRRPMRC